MSRATSRVPRGARIETSTSARISTTAQVAPTRARGLKRAVRSHMAWRRVSRPTRARGLKHRSLRQGAGGAASRPTRARGLKRAEGQAQGY